MARPILTAEQMRTAEAQAIAAGTPETTLMERAGRALAEAVRLHVGPRDVLILCGPGNNGGDGYVAARHLATMGYSVRVAALAEATTDAARRAKGQWDGPIEPFDSAADAPIVIDCLFGTGLSRGLEEAVFQRLVRLVDKALVAVACDIPSGVGADDGALLSPIGHYDITVTFGALKPAHRLMPSMSHMGRVVLADIGIEAETQWIELGAPDLPPLDPEGHKYSREVRRGLCSRVNVTADRRASVFHRPDGRCGPSGRTDRLHPRRSGAGRCPAGTDPVADRAPAHRHRR